MQLWFYFFRNTRTNYTFLITRTARNTINLGFKISEIYAELIYLSYLWGYVMFADEGINFQRLKATQV